MRRLSFDLDFDRNNPVGVPGDGGGRETNREKGTACSRTSGESGESACEVAVAVEAAPEVATDVMEL